MNIILLEDDYVWAELVKEILEHRLKKYSPKVLVVETESGFREQLPEILKSKPSVFLLDVMVVWAFPDPAAPAQPQDVIDGGHWRAGLRCVPLIRSQDEKAPIILYTVLKRSDLENSLAKPSFDAIHISKDSDIETLVDAVRNCMKSRITNDSTS